MKKISVMTCTAALLLSCVSLSASADWSLVPAESSVHFFSVKKDAIGESHSFLHLSGDIKKSGQALVTIDLNSVETNIPIRNERLQKVLFETDKFPQAKVMAKVDYAALKNLKQGSITPMTTSIIIDLHGVQKTYAASLQLVKLSADQLLVTTTAPVIVNAADFGLGAGIEQLKTLASLPAIATSVPVNVSLVFKQ